MNIVCRWKSCCGQRQLMQCLNLVKYVWSRMTVYPNPKMHCKCVLCSRNQWWLEATFLNGIINLYGIWIEKHKHYIVDVSKSVISALWTVSKCKLSNVLHDYRQKAYAARFQYAPVPFKCHFDIFVKPSNYLNLCKQW